MSGPGFDLVGKTIGEYTVEKQLGAGGLGVVIQARAPDGTVVAIKVLTNLTAKSKIRFQRELELGLEVVHPNLVRTLGGGEVNSWPYLVLEFLEGDNLGRVLARTGKVRPDRAAEIADAVAAGLDHLHGLKLTHRDLKPDNIQVLPDGSIKVLDLGMLRAPERTKLTATGTVLGTFLYMSTEQVRGLPAGPPTDIFALGMVLYRMMTLKNPFFESANISLSEYLPLLDRAEPRPLHPHRDDSALDAFFVRALNRHPARRHPSAGELARSFRRALIQDGLIDGTLDASDGIGRTLDLSKIDTAEDLGSESFPDAFPSGRPAPARGRAGKIVGAALLVGAAVFALTRGGAPPTLKGVHPLALSDRHRLLLVETDRPAELVLESARPVARREDGRLHLLSVGTGDDGARILDAGARKLLEARALPPGGWRAAIWQPMGTSRFLVPDSFLSAIDLTAEERRELWPDLPELKEPDGLLDELVEEVMGLDLLVWIDEAHRHGRKGDQLRELVENLGIHHRYRSLVELLRQRQNEAGVLPALHQLALIEIWLQRNGGRSPLDVRRDGLADPLFRRDFYHHFDRPEPSEYRSTFPLHDDHFLAERPAENQKDLVTDIWFQKKNTQEFPLPPGGGPVAVEVFISSAERFGREAYGVVEVNDHPPLFFYVRDPKWLWKEWKRQHPDSGAVRRVFRIPVPEDWLEETNRVAVRFKLWSFERGMRFDEIVMQAFGLTRLR